MNTNKTDKTKVIRIYETFAGIGAQHKAISNLTSKMFKVVQTSEWDVRAVIAYSQIHHQNKFEKRLEKINKWDETKINMYIHDRTFSLDSKKPGRVERKPLDFRRNLIAASEVNNNYPDITKVSGEQLRNIDLLTYSFPCQGLSIANMGRDKGIKEDSDSTSNLIWQIRRILLDAEDKGVALPKYLIMENVKNLLSKKHIEDYRRWKAFLSSLGYETNTIILNGFEHGALQKRERVFGISILNPSKKWSDVEFAKMFKEKYSRSTGVKQRKNRYLNILSSSDQYLDEIKDATPNDTKSRVKMRDCNHHLLDNRKWIKGREYTFNTLTCKQDRHPNIGMIKLPESCKVINKLDYRFITTREAYQIMGFTSLDYDRVKKKYKEGYITKESLYRQAGNSIVVSVLEDVFKFVEDYERGKYE